MRNKHSHKCRYSENDKMQYALMQITQDHRILISAYELCYFDKYLAYAKEKDKGVKIDYSQPDNEPLQIVYGGMMFDKDSVSFQKVKDISDKLAGFAIYDLEEDKVNVSGYEEIIYFPEYAVSETYIPFAALMQTTHRLQNMNYSITMFASASGKAVWEAMVNRPFLLACRESILLERLRKENWKQFIDKKRMMEAYQIADLVTD